MKKFIRNPLPREPCRQHNILQFNMLAGHSDAYKT